MGASSAKETIAPFLCAAGELMPDTPEAIVAQHPTAKPGSQSVHGDE